MLIDYLTERFCFSEANIVLSTILYFLAAAIALILKRLGQIRGGKKYEKNFSTFTRLLLQDIPLDLWGVIFFLLTGCLKGASHKEDRTEDPQVNRAIFRGGLLYPICGAAVAFLLFTAAQFLAAHFGAVWQIPMYLMKALFCANLSLTVFSLLPLPGSDAELFLRTRPFGTKGKSFRENGTYPFFLFALLGILLACIPIPLFNGTTYSLSAIITLFPIILIGG